MVELWKNIVWPGLYENIINQALDRLKSENIVERMWNHDFTVWKDKSDEITNRLGWLHSPRVMREAVKEINDFVAEIRSEGFTRALLLGMGGSSLAPEVFCRTFGVKEGFLDLAVLDSTHPDSVLDREYFADGGKTLFIVSTKSGGTVETMSFMKYFYQGMLKKYGAEKAGQLFVAITDPGSGLESLAGELKFRRIFLNDPNIGGRFSALSYFGLVPAGLIGVDLSLLLNRAMQAADHAHDPDSPAVCMGVFIGALALAGKDKLTMLFSPEITGLGAWIEQLIAESTGKENKGILPVDCEALQKPEYYGPDRLFVNTAIKGDGTYKSEVDQLVTANYPVIFTELNDLYDIGVQFYNWEIATAIAGGLLKINPFDQPNVESAKKLAKHKVAEYTEQGFLPHPVNPVLFDGLTVYSDIQANSLVDLLAKFLKLASRGDRDGKGRSYVSLQAYLNSDSQVSDLLYQLQSNIHRQTKLATTLGFGPRFLHSTGQLHKGDNGEGLFIQIIGKAKKDLPIPDSAMEHRSHISFGILCNAQSLGDREALLNEKRKVMRIELSGDSTGDIKKLINAIGA
jgi:glucose-6-phosphate isomerase